MQYTIPYTHWHLHTWFPGSGESFIQLKNTSSTAKVRGYDDMVETSPAALRIPFLDLSAEVSLERLMGTL